MFNSSSSAAQQRQIARGLSRNNSRIAARSRGRRVVAPPMSIRRSEQPFRPCRSAVPPTSVEPPPRASAICPEAASLAGGFHRDVQDGAFCSLWRGAWRGCGLLEGTRRRSARDDERSHLCGERPRSRAALGAVGISRGRLLGDGARGGGGGAVSFYLGVGRGSARRGANARALLSSSAAARGGGGGGGADREEVEVRELGAVAAGEDEHEVDLHPTHDTRQCTRHAAHDDAPHTRYTTMVMAVELRTIGR